MSSTQQRPPKNTVRTHAVRYPINSVPKPGTQLHYGPLSLGPEKRGSESIFSLEKAFVAHGRRGAAPQERPCPPTESVALKRLAPSAPPPTHCPSLFCRGDKHKGCIVPGFPGLQRRQHCTMFDVLGGSWGRYFMAANNSLLGRIPPQPSAGGHHRVTAMHKARALGHIVACVHTAPSHCRLIVGRGSLSQFPQFPYRRSLSHTRQHAPGKHTPKHWVCSTPFGFHTPPPLSIHPPGTTPPPLPIPGGGPNDAPPCGGDGQGGGWTRGGGGTAPCTASYINSTMSARSK